MSKRRARGEGGISQRHDHESCPPMVDGKRPEHRCQGRWMGSLDLGWSGKKRIRKTVYGKTKREVQVKLADAKRAQQDNALVLKSPTVEAWLTYWLDVICVERGLKVNTMKSHRSKTEQYLIPHLGRHRVDKLQPENVRALYAAMRQQGLSEATLRQTHAILRRALEVAVREGKAGRNVAAIIDPPKTTRHKRTGLSVAEARRVLQGADTRWYVALYLGLRQGEALGLRWSDVHLNADIPFLMVEQTLVREPGVGLVFDTPKSEASHRLVPLPTVVASRFRVAWAEHVATGGKAGDLVFSAPGTAGQPRDHRQDWGEWRSILQAAGVPHVALHAARNTTASLLEEAGVPDRMVAQILGQSTVQVTHGYQSADLPRMAAALGALESLVEPTSERTRGELPGSP